MRQVLCGCVAAGALQLVAFAVAADNAKDNPPTDASSQDVNSPSGATHDGALFDRLDANKDGQLMADEIPDGKQRLFQRLLRAADKDGNGGLNRAEFVAGLADRSPARPLDEKPTLDPGNPSGLPNPDQFFQNFDKNMDGKITVDEVPEVGRERFQQLLLRADKNDDKVLTKEEMTELVNNTNKALKAGANQARDPRQVFAYLDTNGDGKVSLEEVPGERRDGFEKLLKRFDKDADGKMNEEEYVAAMRFVQAQQEGKSDPAPPKASDAKPGETKTEDTKPGDAKPSDSKTSDSKDNKTQRGNGQRQFAKLLAKGFNPEKMAQRIMQMDKNSDGKVSREEAAGSPFAERFEIFDSNQDGFVDQTEIHERLDKIKSAAKAAKAAGEDPAKPGN